MDVQHDSSRMEDQFSHIYYGLAPDHFDIELGNELFRAIDETVKNYMIQQLNPPRDDKKLLVLDVDCTLTHWDGTPRPHLDEMLMRIYRDYDIVLWSADTRTKMLEKINSLNPLNNEDFKFLFFLDRDAMIPVCTQPKAMLVKPLCLIWRNFPQFSARNTIIFDDDWRHYRLNRISGISTNRSRFFEHYTYDRSLIEVASYLRRIATVESLETVKHQGWMQWLDGLPVNRAFEKVKIMDNSITMDVLVNVSKVTLRLSSSEESQLPTLPMNKDDQGHLKFKLETHTPVPKMQHNSSERTSDPVNDDSAVLDAAWKLLTIEHVNPLRQNKKLVILNLPYICDSCVERFPCTEAARPYLAEFLSRVYEHYDIVIWNDRYTRLTTEELTELKLMSNKKYKIASYITKQTEKIVWPRWKPGDLLLKNQIIYKIICKIFPECSSKNSILIGNTSLDLAFPNTLRTNDYRIQHECIDSELRRLARYLETIAPVDDLSKLNHENWTSLDKLSKINEDEKVLNFEHPLQVSIEWFGNKIELMNVHEDVTIENVKNFIFEATGLAAAHQILTMKPRLNQMPRLQPFINAGLLFCENEPKFMKEEPWIPDRIQVKRIYPGLMIHYITINKINPNTRSSQGKLEKDVSVQIRIWRRPHRRVNHGNPYQRRINLNLNYLRAQANSDIPEDFRQLLDNVIRGIPLDMKTSEVVQESGEAVGQEEFPILTDILKMTFLTPHSRIDLELLPFSDMPQLPLNAETDKRTLKIDKTSFIPENERYVLRQIGNSSPAEPDMYNADIQDRVKNYEIELLVPFRNNRKLLVLGLDHTICDPAVELGRSKRPYLHNFLSRAYVFYDIIIWSERDAESTRKTLEALEMMNSRNFKIVCYLTAQAMVEIGRKHRSLEVKPLEVIWQKFPQFSARNTIIVDKNPTSFKWNFQIGFNIPRYKIKRQLVDRQLKRLASYLELIASVEDFTVLRHNVRRLPGKILTVTEDDEFQQQDDRANVIVRWGDNELEFENLHVETTVAEIKTLINDAVSISVDKQKLIYKG